MSASVLFFAVNILIIRGLSLAVPQADGWVASLFRGVVGLTIVGLFFGKRGLELSHLFSRPLLIFRGLLGGFSIIAFYLTVVHLGAGRATIINLSYPIFGTLIATVWLGEKITVTSWLWMVLGFVGIVIFLASDLSGKHAGFSRYDGLALAGAVAAGGVVSLIRQLRHTEHTATIYAAQCLAGVLFAVGPAGSTSLTLPTWAVVVLLAAGTIVAIGQLALTQALRSLSVAKGSAIQMILPLIAAFGGHLLFEETFTAIELAGAALTLGATWQVIRS